MKGKLHTIHQAHIFSDSKSETELENDLGIADVIDSRWGFGRFQGVFDESTKNPAYGKCTFKDAKYIGDFDENADFSGQGVLLFDDGRYMFGTFEKGRFTHGIAHFNGKTAIVREYLKDGRTWLGTVFYDDDGGWADGVFGEDWTLIEGDEFDADGNVVRSVDSEVDEDEG